MLPSEAKGAFLIVGALTLPEEVEDFEKKLAPNRGRTGDLRMIANCNPTLYH